MAIKGFLSTLLALQCILSQSGSAYAALLPRVDDNLYKMNIGGVTWDRTCSLINTAGHTETRMQAIIRAWGGALELAADRLTQTSATLSQSHGNAPSTNQKLEIALRDPAYVQFFKLDWTPSVLTRIGDVWDRITDGVNNNIDKGFRPAGTRGRIFISCGSTYMEGNIDKCIAPSGKTPIAFTKALQDGGGNYGDGGTLMQFCPLFFTLPRFDKLKMATAPGAQVGQNGVTQEDWNRVRTLTPTYTWNDASNLLHELTYITWAGDTNGMSWDGYNWLQSMAEVYGWCQCAALANNGQYNDISYNRNADSYS